MTIEKTTTESTAVATQPTSIYGRLAAKYGTDVKKLQRTIEEIIFTKTEKGFTQKIGTPEQQMSFLLLAEKYDLDVFAKEIVPYVRGGVLMPIVAVDGWFKIATQHEQHDGHEYSESDAKYGGQKQGISGQDVPEWIECTIHRKDWSHPITVREYMDEAFQAKSTTWRSYPRRMLRHRAFVQCARQVYGIGGIYEQSEAESIAEHHGEAQVAPTIPTGINYQPKQHQEIVINDDAVAKAEEFGNGDDVKAQAKADAEAQAKAEAEAQAKADAEAEAQASEVIIDESEVSPEVLRYRDKIRHAIIEKGIPADKIENMLISQNVGTEMEILFLVQQARIFGDEVAIARAESVDY